MARWKEMKDLKSTLDFDQRPVSATDEFTPTNRLNSDVEASVFSNISIILSRASNDCTKEVVHELISELSSHRAPPTFVPAKPSARAIVSIKRSIDRLLGSDKK